MPSLSVRAALCGVLVLGVAATPAFAGSEVVVHDRASATRSIAVEVGDLNLSSAGDQRTLALRVNQAAADVCDMPRGSALNRTASAQNCFATARAGALAQLDARGYAATAAVAAAERNAS